MKEAEQVIAKQQDSNEDSPYNFQLKNYFLKTDISPHDEQSKEYIKDAPSIVI